MQRIRQYARLMARFGAIEAEGQQKSWKYIRAARRLRNRCSRLHGLEAIVDEVLASKTFPAGQKKGEILALLKILRDKQPKYICEVGTAAGGTLFLLSQVAAPDARLISIDVNYSRERYVALPFFARPRQRIACLNRDSQSTDTARVVEEWLRGHKLDFLFIDGDHSLNGVTMDYELYSPLVKPGGLIGFHDIVPDYKTRHNTPTINDTGQVPVFWEEIKKKGRTHELIEDKNQDGFGIGLLEVTR